MHLNFAHLKKFQSIRSSKRFSKCSVTSSNCGFFCCFGEEPGSQSWYFVFALFRHLFHGYWKEVFFQDCHNSERSFWALKPSFKEIKLASLQCCSFCSVRNQAVWTMNACLKQLFTRGTAFWGLGKVFTYWQMGQHNRPELRPTPNVLCFQLRSKEISYHLPASDP